MGHKLLEITQAKGYDTKALFSFDLVPTSYLFYDKGPMKKPNKSMMLHELEKKLLLKMLYDLCRLGK